MFWYMLVLPEIDGVGYFSPDWFSVCSHQTYSSDCASIIQQQQELKSQIKSK